jgi:hypothetical protein
MFKARRPNLTIRPAIARLSEFIYRFWQVRIPRAKPLLALKVIGIFHVSKKVFGRQ